MDTMAIPKPLKRTSLSAILPFLLITFSISLDTVALYLLLPETMFAVVEPTSGRHPLFFVATYSPAIAAIAVVLRFGGVRGLVAFLSRLLLWRCPTGWVAFLLLGIPLVYAAGSLVKGNLIVDHDPEQGMHLIEIKANLGRLTKYRVRRMLQWPGRLLPASDSTRRGRLAGTLL